MVVTLTVLTVIGWCLVPVHTVGFLLIVRARRELNGVQFLLLAALSFVEWQVTLCISLQMLLVLTGHHSAATVFDVHINTGLVLMYYSVMLVFTANRFCELYLNLRYPQYWTVRRVKLGIFFTFSFAMALSVTCVGLQIDMDSIRAYCYTYFYPIFNILSLLSIIATYFYVCARLYALHRYNRKTCARLQQNSDQAHMNSVTTSRNARIAVKKRRVLLRGFLMPSMFIGTFVVFIVIPDMVNCYLYITEQESELYMTVVLISYHLGFLTDAMVYVFLSPTIRRHLLKLLRLSAGGRVAADSDVGNSSI